MKLKDEELSMALSECDAHGLHRTGQDCFETLPGKSCLFQAAFNLDGIDPIPKKLLDHMSWFDRAGITKNPDGLLSQLVERGLA